ncbi:MAG: undecaprenyldiphospho-muramoylpentapeptide beta-N-acetylglucosaminyltransferase [Calditrichaeota bacterium]|nr:MAG: undecaprenyldiphospho-muramoylpentapeptide beta-N-acetylglucosaminyltransferase [Calditrichota bacterium]
MSKKFLFAAGGTGGHVIPAIAIAETIKEKFPDSKITFVGTSRGVENRIVPDAGFPLERIWISGFNRSAMSKNLLFPVKLIVSLFQSFGLLRKVKPDLVIGTGGYVCGPVLYIATLLKIPTLIVEENAFPGVTTKLLANKVDKICIAFEDCKKYLKTTKEIILTGNPIRQQHANVDLETAKSFFKIDLERKVVFTFGGSQGAQSINKVFAEILRKNAELPFDLIWQTGIFDFPKFSKEFGFRKDVRIFEFLKEMNFAYKACDLVVCRSGAMTMTEITNAGLPAVMIPLKFAAENHQEKNARTLEDAGAGIVVLDNNIDSEKFFKELNSLLENPEGLKKMSKNSKQLGNPNANKNILEEVLSLL